MTGSKPVRFSSRDDWRSWLEEHHDKVSEVWVVFHKRHLKAKSLEYPDAVEEAIRFGWIDGKLRRIDDRIHTIRFTPRKPNSVWSSYNRARAERMIKSGKMTPHGMAAVEAAKRSGQWDAAYKTSSVPRMPADLKKALMKNKKAWEYFSSLANSYKQTYVFWVTSAKREETRKKRIGEVVRRTSAGRRLYP
jgi:uncharacterized protein YdeI (YjbR/CyaY-like superfamily)